VPVISAVGACAIAVCQLWLFSTQRAESHCCATLGRPRAPRGCWPLSQRWWGLHRAPRGPWQCCHASAWASARRAPWCASSRMLPAAGHATCTRGCAQRKCPRCWNCTLHQRQQLRSRGLWMGAWAPHQWASQAQAIQPQPRLLVPRGLVLRAAQTAGSECRSLLINALAGTFCHFFLSPDQRVCAVCRVLLCAIAPHLILFAALHARGSDTCMLVS
jgi:hypothetical protein